MSSMAPPSPLALDRSPDDAVLLRRAVQGDGAAFSELYERHGGHAYAVARRILGPTPAAEDAVQDAFLQLWRTGDRYVPERGPLRAWLVTLVRSRAVDLLRRERTRAAAAERARHEVRDRPADADADDDVLRWEHIHVLRGGMVRLPREQAQVLGLLYVAGATQTEVATTLGVPLGTVKGRTRLGLARLRRELSPHFAA